MPTKVEMKNGTVEETVIWETKEEKNNVVFTFSRKNGDMIVEFSMPPEDALKIGFGILKAAEGPIKRKLPSQLKNQIEREEKRECS